MSERLWRLRIGWDDSKNQDLILDAGVISMGGDEIGDLRLYCSKKAVMDQLKSTMDNPAGAFPVFARYWDHFVHGMTIGDAVLIPLAKSRIAAARVNRVVAK